MASPNGIAARLAAFYAAQFAVVGIYLPFWPVWLAAQDLSAKEIGLLIGIGLWTKVVSNAFVTQAADRHGVRQVMIILALGNIPFMALFALAGNFWVMIPLTILSSALFSGKFPLSETLTLAASQRYGLQYGRIRLWGSLAFVIAVTGGGWLISRIPADFILWLLVGGLLIIALVCLLLPDSAPAGAAAQRPLRQAMATPGLLRFILCASLAQASHGAYYAFATLHWRALGYSDPVIGALWAEGVIAEILLFAFGGRLAEKIGPRRLLALASLAGVIRWSGLGLTDSLAVIIALQLLHALTFGATHLAAMQYISRHAPSGTAASAQGLNSSLGMGAFMGVSTMTAGWLYGQSAAATFLVMAALAAAGGIGVIGLGRGKPIRSAGQDRARAAGETPGGPSDMA